MNNQEKVLSIGFDIRDFKERVKDDVEINEKESAYQFWHGYLYALSGFLPNTELAVAQEFLRMLKKDGLPT